MIDVLLTLAFVLVAAALVIGVVGVVELLRTG
jgi:hypothetical protein